LTFCAGGKPGALARPMPPILAADAINPANRIAV
jgi:hypothetical protein